MNRIRITIFSGTLLLAAGAFALQNPAGNQTPQSQPQQGSAQPAQPSQAQPSQNPSTAQPETQSAQPQNSTQYAPRPSIDDQVKTLNEHLNLSPDQQAKVKTALEDQHQQAVAIIQDNAMPREDKIQKVHALRESTITRVRSALNDEQKVKFDQLMQQQEQRAHPQQPGQPPAQQQPPK